MRNNIHMNLFASFILRAASILVKDAMLDTMALTLDPRNNSDNQQEKWANIRVRTHTHACTHKQIRMHT